MRVITGIARGKRLETLSGDDVRPTTDMVKEAVFSIIQFQVQGRVFLDMFAGSGQMGIEALSRGAKTAYFFDMRRDAVAVINKNLKSVRLEESAKVSLGDSFALLSSLREKLDIVFIDPPYRKGLSQRAVELASLKMNGGGVIICETAIEEEVPESAGDFVLDRTYRYGKIKITTYRRPEVI